MARMVEQAPQEPEEGIQQGEGVETAKEVWKVSRSAEFDGSEHDTGDYELLQLRVEIEHRLGYRQGLPIRALSREQEADFDVLQDVLTALVIREREDSHYPWALAALLSDRGKHAEAAHAFLRAADMFEVEFRDESGLSGDEDDWADSARFHAVASLFKSGSTRAASEAIRLVKDEERRAELAVLLGTDQD